MAEGLKLQARPCCHNSCQQGYYALGHRPRVENHDCFSEISILDECELVKPELVQERFDTLANVN